MTEAGIRQVSVARECPTIRHHLRLWEDGEPETRPTLIGAFEGSYRDGSEGNPDAAYMRGQIDLACAIWWYHTGLVIDLSKLAYQWGDMILAALDHPDRRPSAIVVGPGCESALSSLMADEYEGQRVTDLDGVFDNLDVAIAYVRSAAEG